MKSTKKEAPIFTFIFLILSLSFFLLYRDISITISFLSTVPESIYSTCVGYLLLAFLFSGLTICLFINLVYISIADSNNKLAKLLVVFSFINFEKTVQNFSFVLAAIFYSFAFLPIALVTNFIFKENSLYIVIVIASLVGFYFIILHMSYRTNFYFELYSEFEQPYENNLDKKDYAIVVFFIVLVLNVLLIFVLFALLFSWHVQKNEKFLRNPISRSLFFAVLFTSPIICTSLILALKSDIEAKYKPKIVSYPEFELKLNYKL